ncbi:VOC family protein [Spirillospora sp. NPDC000708]
MRADRRGGGRPAARGPHPGRRPGADSAVRGSAGCGVRRLAAGALRRAGPDRRAFGRPLRRAGLPRRRGGALLPAGLRLVDDGGGRSFRHPLDGRGPARRDRGRRGRRRARRPHPQWSPYFEVADCDAATARAVELGARMRSAPADTDLGRFSVLTDPTGVRFAVITAGGSQPPRA